MCNMPTKVERGLEEWEGSISHFQLHTCIRAKYRKVTHPRLYTHTHTHTHYTCTHLSSNLVQVFLTFTRYSATATQSERQNITWKINTFALLTELIQNSRQPPPTHSHHLVLSASSSQAAATHDDEQRQTPIHTFQAECRDVSGLEGNTHNMCMLYVRTVLHAIHRWIYMYSMSFHFVQVSLLYCGN